MMSAQDFPVTFGYGAYGAAGYTAANPHRGNDRKCPVGTPVIVGGVVIGTTGATGRVTGPHLHTQAGTDMGCQKTFNPSSLEFKPGTVVALRTVNEKDWGKFVTVQVGSQYITYAHLDTVNVKVGQVLQGDDSMSLTTESVKTLYRRLFGREGDTGGVKNYTGKTLDFALQDMIGSQEFKNLHTKTVEKIVEKEVIKEVPVEKIVEKEVIKEVPVEKTIVEPPTYFSINDLIKGILYKIMGKEWE